LSNRDRLDALGVWRYEWKVALPLLQPQHYGTEHTNGGDDQVLLSANRASAASPWWNRDREQQDDGHSEENENDGHENGVTRGDLGALGVGL